MSRSITGPLVGTLRPAFTPASPAVAVRHAAVGTPEPPPLDAGSPAAALAALARVDPFGTPATSMGPGSAPGAGSLASVPAPWGPPQDAAPGGYNAVEGLFVARSLDDAVPTDSRLTWTNPWFAEPGPGRAAAVPPLTPTTGPALGPASGWAAGSTMSRSPGGPFVPRPMGVRFGPAVQRRLADGARAPSVPPSSDAFGTGLGTRALDTGDAAASAVPGPVVARFTAGDAPPLTAMTIQRADDGAAAPVPAAGDVAGGASGSPTGDKEMDELARKLYDRIGRRLRHELLVERERSGALVDRGF